jgi:hypothetical protein
MEGARQIRIETNSVQIKLPNNFTYYQYDGKPPPDLLLYASN